MPKSKPLLLFALLPLVAAAAPYCLNPDYVRYRFDVAGTASSAYSIPDSARDSLGSLRVSHLKRPLPCAGFGIFDFEATARRGSWALPGVYVRLAGTTKCRVEVIVPYDPRLSGPTDSIAATIAQLALSGSGVRAASPPVQYELIGGTDFFREWCAGKRGRGTDAGQDLTAARCGEEAQG